MKLRTLLHQLNDCIDNGYAESWLCVLNEDEEEYCIVDVDEDDEGNVVLYAGSDPESTVEDYVEILEDYSSRSNVLVQFDDDTQYNLKGKYFYDDDDDVCFNIYISSTITVPKQSFFDEATQQIDSEGNNKYSKEYEKKGFDGLLSALTNYASRLGVKTVYMTLWLYYALKVAPLTSKTTIMMALGYLVSPIDLISDLIPFVGLTDDAAVITAAFIAISKVLSDVDAKVVTEKAKAKLHTIFPNYQDSDLDLI